MREEVRTSVRTKERKHAATGLPDELGLHGVVERHEHLCVLADLTHHILQSHKEGKRRRGGKLCLPAQINILLLRLSGGNTEALHSTLDFSPIALCHMRVDLRPAQFEKRAQEKIDVRRKEILYVGVVCTCTPDY